MIDQDFYYIYLIILIRQAFGYIIGNEADWFYRGLYYEDLQYEDYHLSKKINEFIDYLQSYSFFQESYSYSMLMSYTFAIHFFFQRLIAPVRIFLHSKYGQTNTAYLKTHIEKITSVPIFFEKGEEGTVDLVITDTVSAFKEGAENILVHAIPYPAELEVVKEVIGEKFYANHRGKKAAKPFENTEK